MRIGSPVSDLRHVVVWGTGKRSGVSGRSWEDVVQVGEVETGYGLGLFYECTSSTPSLFLARPDIVVEEVTGVLGEDETREQRDVCFF